MGHVSRLSDFVKEIENKFSNYYHLLKSYRTGIETPFGINISPARIVLIGAGVLASTIIIPHFAAPAVEYAFGYDCTGYHPGTLSIETDKNNYVGDDSVEAHVEGKPNTEYDMVSKEPSGDTYDKYIDTDHCGSFHDHIWTFDPNEHPAGNYTLSINHQGENATKIIYYDPGDVTVSNVR